MPVVKEHGALFILDGVCATAAIEEDMSKAYQGNPAYRIDVVLSGSQKAIGVPPVPTCSGLVASSGCTRSYGSRSRLLW